MANKTSVKKQTVVLPPQYSSLAATAPMKMNATWRIVIIILILVLVGLFAANKGMLVSAVVNGKPIFSWELNSTLRSRYGDKTLEGLIGEKLIADEASKQGVVVTDAELDAKQKEILATLGANVTLDDFLKFQGLTKADFQHQLKVQLVVERLLTKGLTITDDDIKNYIATNQATLTATEPAALKEEARQAIVSNSVSEKLQEWFTGLRQKAAVMKFL
jgi:hypothetical protein